MVELQPISELWNSENRLDSRYHYLFFCTRCTNPSFWGCERTGTPTNVINPIRSARVRTVNSFAFRYGRIEVQARIPSGDWLWPAIWLMPKYNAYGTWPASGEIDLMESRGKYDHFYFKFKA